MAAKNQDFRDALALAFQREELPLPEGGETYALLEAQALPGSGIAWKDIFQCEQGFRPLHLELAQKGYQTEKHIDLSSKGLGGIVVLPNRSRAINEINITRAWNGLRKGGFMVFAADNKAGVKSLRKWVATKAEIAGDFSKHHAVVFWITKKGDNWPLDVEQTEVGSYKIGPGMFSADGPDAGSILLASHFDQRIRGKVADFGAGWGFLAGELLAKSDKIESMELHEANWSALQAAKQNVPSDITSFHWTDISSEAPRGPFDWIVMNPPFHSARAAEPELGVKFINAAAKALPQGGRLLMVANRNLPYERTLNDVFRKVVQLDDAGGFKVIEAMR
jgi:16S rRNA (guanine1207-N2)-methyltransferase